MTALGFKIEDKMTVDFIKDDEKGNRLHSEA